MSLWSHTAFRAVTSPARISSCNHSHICRTFSSETALQIHETTISPSNLFARRHIATLSPTMPQRIRKRASAHVDAQDNQSTRAADVPTPSEASSNGPRRSSRRKPVTREPPLVKEDRTGNPKKRLRGVAMDVDEISSIRTEPVGDVAKRLEDNAADGPAAALRHLEEMEASFKSDIKRRRLQIEQSIPYGSLANMSAPVRKLRGAAPSGKSDVMQLDRILLTPDDDKDWACETAKDDECLSGDELIETINGAKRPPAVNSDYLPLPWKGRLGYVSSVTRRCDNQ
jgi:hypothetical protein